MVGSLYRTMTQKRKKKTPVNQSLSESEDGAPKPKKATKKVIRKKVHYIKKLEARYTFQTSKLQVNLDGWIN